MPPSSPPTTASRLRASLLTLAITDSLGAPLEFGPRRHPPNQVTTLLPNANFNLPAGHFTDDTSMALCLASSLVENDGKHIPADQARRYLKWMRDGEMSSVRYCFDVGFATVCALEIWEEALKDVQAGSETEIEVVTGVLERIGREFAVEDRCGNGSLMRCLPCALVAADEDQAVELARRSSEVTHPHRRCKAACEVYVRAVWRALQGETKEEIAACVKDLIQRLSIVTEKEDALILRLKEYGTVGDWQGKQEKEIKSSGYVVHSLEAALWAFFSTDTLKDGAVKVVNLGDDADTVGAIYGGLAGAFYGVDKIPKDWINKMQSLNMVEDVVNRISKFKGLS